MKRPFTAEERREVFELAKRGRLGQSRDGDLARCQALYSINPTEYAEVGAEARKAADATVNPLA